MFELEEIYDFVPKEMFSDLNEFSVYANENGVKDFYEYMPDGMFNSEVFNFPSLPALSLTSKPLVASNFKAPTFALVVASLNSNVSPSVIM